MDFKDGKVQDSDKITVLSEGIQIADHRMKFTA